MGTILMIGIATNIDNLCIGFSYGLLKKSISWYLNLIIALVSGGFACAACLAARFIVGTYSHIATIIGAVLLIGLGAYSAVSSLVKPGDGREIKGTRSVGFSEAMILGITLAVNCLPVSFGAGLFEVPSLWLGVSITACSFIAVGAGNAWGKKATELLSSKWLNMAGGIFLIVIGVWELFT